MRGPTFIDIETLPDLREGARELARSLIKVPGNYSKPDSIAKYIEDNVDGEWRKTALNGGYGQVLCVSAMHDGVQTTFLRAADAVDDRQVVSDFLTWATTQRFSLVVGHNVLWDLKFLYHRAMVLELGPLYWGAVMACGWPHNPALWSDSVFDTSYEWTQDRGRGISLDELCGILGVETPKQNGLTGATVYDYWLAGKADEIVAYCEADVRAAKALYERLSTRQ